jgi:putative membrane-bound dehydrogenase-like protein
MKRDPTLLRFPIVFLAALGAGPLLAQGFPPAEAVARMRVMDGFEASLVAAEPLVRQPVAIEFDDRGRLWVLQYLQYPNPAGLERVRVDRWSRTVYDRVPPPPPRGPRGADRITILEDADGDGVAERGKDFADGLNLASSIAFGRGGVFVLNVPYLLFYADRDRDDRPDGDPEPLLEGFGMQDAHSVANSLAWGPDGWLYGAQGSTVSSSVRGIEFEQGVWRYHPESRRFELFCEGGGNSWGLDFDEKGELLYSTNVGGHVCLHGVPGAYYWKSFEKHGDLHNPYAFGFLDHVPHAGFRGGHVSVGGVFYRGTSFPAAFRGRYIAADLLGHAVYVHDLERRGSSFRSRHGGELLVANDTWFAPTDVALGPDGALYVADWHDARTAHPDPDADWDRSNGRIVRIRARGARPEPLTDLHALSSDDLAAKLADPNGWTSRRARRILAERRDAALWPRLRALLSSSPDPQLALEALWALAASGGLDAPAALGALAHPDPHVRAWAARLLADGGELPEGAPARLVDLARTDPSAVVRARLLSAAKRLPAETALAIAAAIALRDEDGADPHAPLLLWWAIEPHAAAAIDRVEALFGTDAMRSSKLAREWILPRLVRRWAAEGGAPALASAAAFIARAAPANREPLLAALDEGLGLRGRGRRGTGSGGLFRGLGEPALESSGSEAEAAVEPAPPALTKLLDEWAAASPGDARLIRIRARLKTAGAIEAARELALDPRAERGAREAMLALLAERRGGACVEPLLAALQAEAPEWLQLALINALAPFHDPRVPKRFFEVYPACGPSARARLRRALLARADWARALLERVDAGAIDAKDAALDELRIVALHGDGALDALVQKHWGRVRAGTAEEKLAEMRRLQNDLRAGAGEPARGREVFRERCGACHRLGGEGAEVGPDLTHSNRADREFLLVSLVDPGRVVRREFAASVLQLSGGRVLLGRIVEESPAALVVVDAKAARHEVRREELADIRAAETSLMPEDLLKDLEPRKLRDLFSFLEDPSIGHPPSE